MTDPSPGQRPEPFLAEHILERLGPDARGALNALTVLAAVDSTNAELLRLPAEAVHAHAVLADSQTAGRGRRGRHWHSPPRGNIYLSLGWEFRPGGPALSLVPLVTGVIVARVLESVGVAGVALKWPNDVLLDGQKVAGILVESRPLPNAAGALLLVIGTGVNVAMPEVRADPALIAQPWTDVATHLADPPHDLRQILVISLLDGLLTGLPAFSQRGWSAFESDWTRLDALLGQAVEVRETEKSWRGTARGVDAAGALRVQLADGTERTVHAGDVSIRRS